MKIVYDKARTIERIESDGQLLITRRKRRNTIWLMNLLLVLVVIAIVAAYCVTGSTLPTFSGVCFIVSLIANIISVFFASKLVPKHPASILSAAAWYHIQTSGLTVLEVKAEKDNGRCTVSVMLDDHGEQKTLDLGAYEIRESSEVEEDTLDLEQEVVLVPAAAEAEVGPVV